MVELRKRKAPVEPVAPPPTKRANSVKTAAKPKDAPADKQVAPTNGNSSKTKVSIGENITLEGFGGEIETNDGEKTTLKKLVEESKGGVVLFTYPKASTPGCKLSVSMLQFSSPQPPLKQERNLDVEAALIWNRYYPSLLVP